MASQRFVDWNAAWIMGLISDMSTFRKDVVMKDATGLTSVVQEMFEQAITVMAFVENTPKSVKGNNGVIEEINVSLKHDYSEVVSRKLCIYK